MNVYRDSAANGFFCLLKPLRIQSFIIVSIEAPGRKHGGPTNSKGAKIKYLCCSICPIKYRVSH